MLLSFVSRYVALICLLLSFLWFLQTKDIGTAIAFISAIGVFVAQDVYFVHKADAAKRNDVRDSKLLETLLELIRPEIDINFLKNQDHGEGIDIRRTYPFSDFVHSWNTVDKEFLDVNLEKLKKKAYRAASKYVDRVAVLTYSEREGLSRLNENFRYTEEEKWKSQRQELNSLADKTAIAIEELIRVARKKL